MEICFFYVISFFIWKTMEILNFRFAFIFPGYISTTFTINMKRFYVASLVVYIQFFLFFPVLFSILYIFLFILFIIVFVNLVVHDLFLGRRLRCRLFKCLMNVFTSVGLFKYIYVNCVDWGKNSLRVPLYIYIILYIVSLFSACTSLCVCKARAIKVFLIF